MRMLLLLYYLWAYHSCPTAPRFGGSSTKLGSAAAVPACLGAEIWNHIVSDNAGKWKAVGKYEVKETFNPSENDPRLQAQRLAQMYNLDVMESLLPEKLKCASCGKEAEKTCSRFQGEWYCQRECQVKHWPRHKKACQLTAEATEKIQRDLNLNS